MSERVPAVGPMQRRSLIVGLAVLAVCVLGAFVSPAQFFRAYLAAYQFYLGIALGAWVIVMIHHLTGGAWGFFIQRILEAGMRTLPYLALLFIPVACGMSWLYLWTDPAEVAADKQLQHRQIYLNAPFFCGRAALFFLLWIVVALLLDYWSRRHDETGDERYARWQANLSGPGLILFGISMTFAAVDWIMSLEPTFRSTIFGPLVATGQVLSAHAVALIALAWLAPRSDFGPLLSPKVLSDLGNLLFTFLVVWAYMVWFQFMLIWMANLPHEAAWYLARSQGGWQWVAWALTVLHFAVPFFLLLLRDLKQNLPALARVAALILTMQLVYDYYLIMPAFPDTTIAEHWMDFLTPVGLGGVWLWCFLRELTRRPLLPRRAEDRAEAAHLLRTDLDAAHRPQEA